MTNRQWLMNEMQNMSDEELACYLNGEDFICSAQCDCPAETRENFSCSICRIEWLQAEHKEMLKLLDVERVILENVNNKWEWICRDKAGNLRVFYKKPKKDKVLWVGISADYSDVEVFNHLFKFIKWEDEEPYNIEELLKGE